VSQESSLNLLQYARSFSGGCQGDMSSSIWIGGLEPGRGKEPNLDVLGAAPTHPPSYEWEDVLKWQYWKRTRHLVVGIVGRDTPPPTPMKINIYPVACETMGSPWTQEFANTTGFSSKQLYQAWCQHIRFPWISQLVMEHRPRIIVGTGSGYLLHFMHAFFGSPEMQVVAWTENSLSHREQDGKVKNLSYYHLIGRPSSGGPIHLFVTPFLSYRAGALNSTSLLHAVGRRIRDDVDLLDSQSA